MKLHELPTDILYRIITFGDLDIGSILNLAVTNKQLFGGITSDDQIWRYVYYHSWGFICEDYHLSDILRSDRSYFDNVMAMYVLGSRFESDLLAYEPMGAHNIGHYLNSYTHDDVYLPIIVQQLNKKHDRLLLDLKRFHDTELTQLSLLTNLINCQNFRIGLSYLNDPSESNFEYAWFKTSIMNNGSHKLIQNRLKKLHVIRSRLYDKVYNQELLFQNSAKVRLSSGNDLSFEDESAYVKFMIKVVNVIYSCFSIDSLKSGVKLDASYFHDHYIEDFDILRVYSDLSKGHPYVIMAIIQKVLYEFMGKFNSIKINQDLISFTADINKVFLKINNFYVFPNLIRHGNSRQPYNMEAFTSGEVVDYLRNLNLNSVAVQNFLQPLCQSEYKDIVIKIGQLGTLHSSSACVIFERKSTEFLNVNEVKFKEFMCKFQFYKSMGGYSDFSICSEFEKYLMNSNNFIHFNTLYQTLRQRNNQSIAMLSEYFKLPTDIVHNEFYGKNVDLLDEKSPISFHKVIEGRVRPALLGGRSASLSNKIARGQLIRHARFDTIGVVLGRADDTNNDSVNQYYYVHTKNKSIEVYDVNSLIAINDPISDKELVINFIERAGVETIGLLYFSEIQYLDGTPFFLDIKA